YKIRFNEVQELRRVPTSILPEGYVTGINVGLIGPPGTGKSRFALQEAMVASSKGKDSLYLYNESVKKRFDAFIKLTADQLGFTESQLQNITFCDMTRNPLTTADYNSMQTVAERIWIQNVRYWVDNMATKPTFIFLDSYSCISRRYVPQMSIFFGYIINGLQDYFAEAGIEPVVFTIQQKSQSSRELNDDSVVGGFGINHTLDMEVVLKRYDVDRWIADRYSIPEGTQLHTLSIPKDRYSEKEYSERVIVLDRKDGRLKLSDEINQRMMATRKAKEDSKRTFSSTYSEPIANTSYPEE
ncbi:MAG: P-loop NTPase family protein, partial [Bacillati bacterium]